MENSLQSINTLNFRSLGLNPSNIISILDCLEPLFKQDSQYVTSISFSYNSLVGNTGAIELANRLPITLKELGLVNCGISEMGGMALLEWIKTAKNLTMVCVERNNFSKKLKTQYEQFVKANPKITLVL